jgi:hypothetical protein
MVISHRRQMSLANWWQRQIEITTSRNRRRDCAVFWWVSWWCASYISTWNTMPPSSSNRSCLSKPFTTIVSLSHMPLPWGLLNVSMDFDTLKDVDYVRQIDWWILLIDNRTSPDSFIWSTRNRRLQETVPNVWIHGYEISPPWLSSWRIRRSRPLFV